MTKSIGDRMKRYEAAYDHAFTPRMPLFIRVDGRAFHTFLRKADKPFDERFISAMIYTAITVAKEMQGFKLAYVQSDECTFCLTDYDDLSTQGWFDYQQNKIVSLTAALFSTVFNSTYEHNRAGIPPVFDARAFVVPVEDAPNVFVWRQWDWERNSIQMLARSHFSHKECHQKRIPDLHEMLHSVGVNWAHLDNRLKNGTFIPKGEKLIYEKLSYEQIADLIRPTEPIKLAPRPGSMLDLAEKETREISA